MPHQCKHLLYDDMQPISYETRVRQKQTMAAKRARRATIASASPFVNAVSEKVVDDVESHVRTVQGTTHEDFNKHASIDDATKELEDGYMAFERVAEDNYHGRITSNSAEMSSSIITSIEAQFSSIPNRCHASSARFSDLTNSPSAFNLVTIEKARSKEIESALRYVELDVRDGKPCFNINVLFLFDYLLHLLIINRHRRQQQSVFHRGTQRQSSLQNHSSGEHVQISNLKSKAEWFLQQQSNSSANNSLSTVSNVSSSSKKNDSDVFIRRIASMEEKFNAASGLNCLERQYLASHKDQQPKLSSKCGTHVLSTATSLEQVLNPKFQDAKLKKKAETYRKEHNDIKVHCITKMTKETDWSKRRWDKLEQEAKGMQ